MASSYLAPGVYVEEKPAGSVPIEAVGTAVAAFVGFASMGPVNQPTLVTNWTQFTTTFGGLRNDVYLARAVLGYFLNGGGRCYVVRVPGEPAAAVVPGGDGPAQLPPGSDATSNAEVVPALPSATVGGFTVQAKPDAPTPLSVEVAAPADDTPPDQFTLVVRSGDTELETLSGLSVKPGKAFAPSTKSKYVTIAVTEAGGTLERPPAGRTDLVAPAAAVPAVPGAAAPVTAGTFIGDSSERTGLNSLVTVDDVTMLCVPDLMWARQQELVDDDGVQSVQAAMIDYCTNFGDRMAILDPPPGLNSQQVGDYRSDGLPASPFATLYWPWITAVDPLGGPPLPMPPSGYLAGIWSRNDDTRGVHKAPANEPVRGAVGVEYTVTTEEQQGLNSAGVNCIRPFPGRGPIVWGARTLATGEWRYVNVRRLFNFLETSIKLGTQWCVFEPNDEFLWARIRRSISAFLVMQWRAGALFGATPADAFFVKCDGELNTAETIDAGQVICEIGVAPVKPAEFVIFRMTQFSGGTSLTE